MAVQAVSESADLRTAYAACRRQRDQLESELLAAQEREKRLQSMIDNKDDLWADLRDALKQEKALREALTTAVNEFHLLGRPATAHVLAEALAGSPSEKPDG
ncbi:MAG TPA: hypothetical protein VNH41_03465 [Steroidobacteraceae bacterium]|nr:hypothetical protein [Steroidobacteraceae bacterium]